MPQQPLCMRRVVGSLGPTLMGTLGQQGTTPTPGAAQGLQAALAAAAVPPWILRPELLLEDG